MVHPPIRWHLYQEAQGNVERDTKSEGGSCIPCQGLNSYPLFINQGKTIERNEELISQFVPQCRRLPEYPLRRRKRFSLVLGPSLRYAPPLEPLHNAAVLGPHEVHDAVPRPVALGAGGRDDAVAAGAEDAVGEAHRGVAEVDDGAAPLGLHPQPLAGHVRLPVAQLRLPRRLRPHLQAAQPVHQDGDSAGGGKKGERESEPKIVIGAGDDIYRDPIRVESPLTSQNRYEMVFEFLPSP